MTKKSSSAGCSSQPRVLDRGIGLRTRGVEHEHLDRPEALDARHEVCHLALVRDVAHRQLRHAPVTTDGVDDVVPSPSPGQAVDDDPQAVRGEAPGDGRAQAAGAPVTARPRPSPAELWLDATCRPLPAATGTGGRPARLALGRQPASRAHALAGQRKIGDVEHWGASTLGVDRRGRPQSAALVGLPGSGYASTRLNISAPIAFVVLGLVLTHGPFALIDVHLQSSTARSIAEVTLALVLFVDASRINVQSSGPTPVCPFASWASGCHSRSASAALVGGRPVPGHRALGGGRDRRRGGADRRRARAPRSSRTSGCRPASDGC